MSIVVKGAKMPNNCGACPLRLAWCTQRLYMITRPERCPLEPIRNGKWVAVHDPVFADTYYCSVCKKEPNATDTGWVLSDFCPNCGADMRGGKGDG